MPAFDYGRVADIYDSYVEFDGGLTFFRDLAAGTGGFVLELMVGTGRVSLPLLRDSCRLVGVDSSLPMLAEFQRKAKQEQLAERLVCADVGALPLAEAFDLVLWPFHGLSELSETEEQRTAVEEARRVMAPEGRFVCTLHNPEVRLRSIDGEWHRLGTIDPAEGRGKIVFSSRFEFDPGSRLVSGVQRFEELDEEGKLLEERSIPILFSLPSRSSFETMIENVGLEVQQFFGSYSEEPFEAKDSPYMIWILKARKKRSESE
jgi:SAM-dependent methyltransferase